MRCDYFDAGVCRSCTLLGTPYAQQVAEKERHARHVLGEHTALRWLPPVTSRPQGFRNKAKMVVAGTVDAPTVGILDAQGRGTDLRDCGLYTPGLRAAFPVLAELVTRARLVPYDVPARRGEFKHLLVTESPDGELMVRFVLRSQESLARIRKHLPWLRQVLPSVRVASVNLLPEHRAALEGEQEILLTEESALPMRLGEVELLLRPQSFFQTNTEVAAAVYAQARAWVDAVGPGTVWDLYCGVGGFALHCAAPDRDVLGVEVSAEAVASARASAARLGHTRTRFEVGDATAVALAAPQAPDVVVVNPPRRGIGGTLAGWLASSSARTVVYSSCNVESLARDLRAMPGLVPVEGVLLDMFPQTSHGEVMVLLERR